MTDLRQFEERVRERVAEAEQAREQRARKLTEVMADQEARRGHLEARRQRFQAFAEPFHVRVVKPRFDMLARHFPSLSTDCFRTSTGYFSIGRLARTERFPASTTLTLGLDLDSAGQTASVLYRLEIVPRLMSYDTTDHLDQTLDDLDEAKIDDWVEAQMLRFVQTYLRLATEPNYQRENRVVDPVCGMEVSRVDVVHRCEFGQQFHFFCSEACWGKFLANPALYLAGLTPGRSGS
jgi:YHS domain-containing protein